MTQIPVVKKIKSFEMLKVAWEETKHPRDESGEFAPEGGGGASSSESRTGSLKREPKGAESQASGWRTVKAGDKVSGLEVMEGEIPNEDSIESSLDHYHILEGIREVPTSAFEELSQGSEELANQIRESGKIKPLIVVVDGNKNGIAYILEGSHRFDALNSMGVKSFPAKVVIDEDGIDKNETSDNQPPDNKDDNVLTSSGSATATRKELKDFVSSVNKYAEENKWPVMSAGDYIKYSVRQGYSQKDAIRLYSVLREHKDEFK
jgi:hypothetical protein